MISLNIQYRLPTTGGGGVFNLKKLKLRPSLQQNVYLKTPLIHMGGQSVLYGQYAMRPCRMS